MRVVASELTFIVRPIPGLRTTCEFCVLIDGIAAWPVRGAEDALIEIQIDDLLGYLTDFWKPLMLRQVYPLATTPERPSAFRKTAELNWKTMSSDQIAGEDEEVSNFEEAHDLSRCFGGIFGLSPLWMLRSGDGFLIDNTDDLWELPFEEARIKLAALGDDICDRLSAADFGRWDLAIEGWHRRNDTDVISLLAWSTGLGRAFARNLVDEGILQAPLDFDDAANDNDELRIAARMAGALPDAQIRSIIGLARQFSSTESGYLRKLAVECAEFIKKNFENSAYHHQGEVAADYLREILNIPSEGMVDIFEVSRLLGLEVRHQAVEPIKFDGLAIWGSHHGPGVFLNEASQRISKGAEVIEKCAGARVTLAHELCHLLLDGGHALSAVEVLKARMPLGVEQRAKSFAGEFLLPSRLAAKLWQEADRPTSKAKLRILLVSLEKDFGVTRSVAAWKLDHGVKFLNVNLRYALNDLAPFR